MIMTPGTIMKRTLLILLVIMLFLSVLSGCAGEGADRSDFDFSYTVEKAEYTRGETVHITATVKNISGWTYRYTGCSGEDFIPSIELYSHSQTNGDEQKYVLACDPVVFPTDEVYKKVKNGESGSYAYSFLIPEDAKLGEYSVTLSWGEESQTFSGVLKIAELTAQNEADKYAYSSVTVRSDSHSIRPIQCFFYTTQYENGEPVLEGDGDGVYRIFSDPQTDISDFPVLVTDGAVAVSVPAGSSFWGIQVYDTAFQELPYSIRSFEELSGLPEGEYLIVFSEEIDGRGGDPQIQSYWMTVHEDLFRLVIGHSE